MLRDHDISTLVDSERKMFYSLFSRFINFKFGIVILLSDRVSLSWDVTKVQLQTLPESLDSFNRSPA